MTLEHQIDPGRTADDIVDEGQRAEQIRAFVQELPESLGLPIVYHYFHDMSQAEIAEALGKTDLPPE